MFETVSRDRMEDKKKLYVSLPFSTTTQRSGRVIVLAKGYLKSVHKGFRPDNQKSEVKK